MTGRYALRDPDRSFLLYVEEVLEHDEQGYCRTTCLEAFHGGRHRSAGKHKAFGRDAQVKHLAEWVSHCETHGTCHHHDAHPGGKHRRTP